MQKIEKGESVFSLFTKKYTNIVKYRAKTYKNHAFFTVWLTYNAQKTILKSINVMIYIRVLLEILARVWRQTEYLANPPWGGDAKLKGLKISQPAAFWSYFKILPIGFNTTLRQRGCVFFALGVIGAKLSGPRVLQK